MTKSMYEAWDDLFEALKRLMGIFVGPISKTIAEILERVAKR